MNDVRAFSFGCGVQSMAALVLAARGDIDFPLFLFANVGADSENPATLDYLVATARPYAEASGIELVELHRTRRDGTRETLLERIRSAKASVPIPMRMANGAPGNRQCTGGDRPPLYVECPHCGVAAFSWKAAQR